MFQTVVFNIARSIYVHCIKLRLVLYYRCVINRPGCSSQVCLLRIYRVVL